VDSLEPVDWAMYADMLLEAGAPERQWRRAQRISRSLQADPRLVLVARCEAVHLEGHHLRIGETYFIPVPGTFLENYQLTWWRIGRVRAGFRRYPSRERRGQYSPKKMLAWAHKTAFEFPHVVAERPRVILKFFVGHSRP
jgi:hypothetical protein